MFRTTLAGLMVFGTAAVRVEAQAPIVITAARLIVGDGRVVDSPVVIVQGTRISAVGTRASVPIPTGARIIDLAGQTLLPGLIDTHTHMNSADAAGGDSAVLKETAAHAAVYGTVNARKTLDAGFTTVRDVGMTDYSDVAVRDLIARGVIPGPRMYVSGPSLGIIGGHSDVNGYNPAIPIPGTGVIVTGADEGPDLTRSLAAADADLFAVFFVGCDPARLATMVTDDHEFYHDKAGVVATSGAAFIADYRKNCEARKAPDAWRSRRELVPGSMRVDPVPGYGAIEYGEHRFYERKGDGAERLAGFALFTMLWKLEAGTWKLARVMSYGHRAAP